MRCSIKTAILLWIFPASVLSIQAVETQAKSRIIDFDIYLYAQPNSDRQYSYDDIKNGKIQHISEHSWMPLNPGIEGTIYPFNILRRIDFQLPDILKYFGIEGAAAYTLLKDLIKTKSVTDCQKFISPCSKGFDANYYVPFYTEVLMRYGIQVSLPLYQFANGYLIKSRFAIGQYITKTLFEGYAKDIFFGNDINLQDTTLKDYYFRSLFTLDVPVMEGMFDAYFGIGLIYIHKSLRFGSSGIETISDIFNVQLVAGVAY